MTGKYVLIGLLLSLRVVAQQSGELIRFTKEKVAPDGQVYLYTGMQNSAGIEVIPALFEQIWDFNGDTITLARKLRWDPLSESMLVDYQMITRSGFLYYEFPAHIEPVQKSEGLILCLNQRNLLYGYLDLQGNTKIRFAYSGAGEFSQGLAPAENPSTRKWGYLNKDGKWAIPAEFDLASRFSESYAAVQKGDKWYFSDFQGKLLPIEGSYQEVFELREGFSVVTIQRGDSLFYGAIRQSGKEVIPPQYEFLDHFEQGTAVFQVKGRTGMLDTSGKVVVPALFDELYRYDQQYYVYQLNGLQGLINLEGKIVLPARYTKIGYFHEGLCPVYRSGKWGFANTLGQEQIPCQYPEIRREFTSGTAEVRQSDKWWIAKGKDTLALPDYDEVLPYFGEVAPFRLNQHWGFLNIHGEECAEPQFDELLFNKNGLIFARYTHPDSTFSWSVFSNTGKLISEGKYLDIVRSSEGLSAVRTREGWGFINASGIPVCSPRYSAVRNYSEGRAAVCMNNEWGFISESGVEVIPIAGKTPPLPDSIARSTTDSLRIIRETFGLYRRQVLGDFQNNCACIHDSLNLTPLCLNRVGKVSAVRDCKPFTKQADQIDGSEFENKAIQVIRKKGAWVEIDQNGTVIR